MQNVYGNQHSPSKDIAFNFAVLQQLRFICSGGHYSDSDIQYGMTVITFSITVFRCGKGLQKLYNSVQVQMYLNCLPAKVLLQAKNIYISQGV